MLSSVEEQFGGELDFTRKYRPERFEDYIGNDDVRERLYTQLSRGYFPRKFSIEGYTGSGKTTLARIIVREYLCPNRDPVMGACSSDDCYFCNDTLFYVKTGNFDNLPDIRELDMGQDGGKSVSIEIKEWIEYPPEDSEYKIIVIDEAHKGTKAFWEANLKWIEDPPSFLVVIIATTDPELIPKTVLNRFNERYVIKRPSIPVLVGRLAFICEEEGIAYEAEALRVLAQSANQVPRSAIHKLEGAFRTYGSIYTEDVIKQENAFRDDVLNEFISSYLNQDFATYFHALSKVSENGNINKFLHSLINYTLRGIKIVNGVPLESLTTQEINGYKEFFKQFSPADIANLLANYKDALSGDAELKLTAMIYNRYNAEHPYVFNEDTLPNPDMVSKGNTNDLILRAKAIKQDNQMKREKGIEALSSQQELATTDDLTAIFNPIKVEQ